MPEGKTNHPLTPVPALRFSRPIASDIFHKKHFVFFTSKLNYCFSDLGNLFGKNLGTQIIRKTRIFTDERSVIICVAKGS